MLTGTACAQRADGHAIPRRRTVLDQTKPPVPDHSRPCRDGSRDRRFLPHNQPTGAQASGGGAPLDKFPTERVTNLPALQNGARLFVNYCQNCHSANYMRYNRMRDIGLTETDIKRIGSLVVVILCLVGGSAAVAGQIAWLLNNYGPLAVTQAQQGGLHGGGPPPTEGVVDTIAGSRETLDEEPL